MKAIDYIEKTLGERVVRQPWQEIENLPYYLSDEYDMQQVTIGTQECLILLPKGRLPVISALKKHIGRIKQSWNAPVVIELKTISYQRRQTLIEHKIPFIVPEKQLFLPFMGAYLQEKLESKEEIVVNHIQPSAQMLLLHFIYNKNAPLYLSQMPETLGFSAMTISRSAKQLSATGFLETHKEGVQVVLTSTLSPKELFERTEPLLTNPVRKIIYMDKTEIKADFFIAGLSALTKKSMLNLPTVSVYGTTTLPKTKAVGSVLIDSEKQCEVELWKYKPTVLSGENCADTLSLALSLREEKDERIQIAISESVEKELQKDELKQEQKRNIRSSV